MLKLLHVPEGGEFILTRTGERFTKLANAASGNTRFSLCYQHNASGSFMQLSNTSYISPISGAPPELA